MRTTTRCRALVAGFGRPGMRDLDFGRQLVRYLEGLGWPDDVVVEDLSYAATLVLHRLQELDPAKVVLVGAVARGFDAPGALRRYRVDTSPPPPQDVQRSLEESVQGVVHIDHTLAVARHWGRLPADTTIVEVEPADCSFGPGFSEELATAFDDIVAAVRAEVDCTGEPLETTVERGLVTPPTVGTPTAGQPSEALAELVRYAERHEASRLLEPHRAGDGYPNPTQLADGLTVLGRRRPWSVTATGGGDWYDVIPLADGWFSMVIGDVGGRGVEASAAMADLRAAVRAYAAWEGRTPGRVLDRLDGLVRTLGMGDGATAACLALHPATRALHLANAGHVPPLLLGGRGGSDYLWHGRSEPLGRPEQPERREAHLVLAPGSTLLLYTDGLVRSGTQSVQDGLVRLRRTATCAPRSLDVLCDHVLAAGTSGRRRDDDISLLAVNLSAEAA